MAKLAEQVRLVVLGMWIVTELRLTVSRAWLVELRMAVEKACQAPVERLKGVLFGHEKREKPKSNAETKNYGDDSIAVVIGGSP